ncbi:T9SS type A sorting domain-containing protein [Flavobacterium litorale]|uniref:T9SS type A sorting domain-containing protein n=1 Tax=Flavobacterium litorale TaxID=2856519 RepID=A0ABX8V743_9FLAO|nr:T9SS type A sorting domain-containing protein [Flavobacterium litorale]QYJ68659.1 T9SS type A sorting domain-containing protein [Flavobacterium litorale]
MMKRLLLVVTVLIAGTFTSFAQFDNIGLLGGSTATGWTSDTDMMTTDGVIYTLNDVVITVPDVDPGVKFRKDDDWTENWGGDNFPSGTATPNGGNIPAVNGTYNVTFNLSTLEYSFENVAGFDEVLIEIGDMDVTMVTLDGTNYTAENVMLEAGNLAFIIDDTNMGWGSADFPSGTAVEGQQIPVLANSYNISFNLDTKAYSFDYVMISMIGDGVVDWNTDTPMETTDGINYTYMLTSSGGPGKFRLNNAWNPGWGATDFPMGIGSTEGDAPNIPIAAGTYNVSFNRITGAYNFDDVTASVADFGNNKLVVYPNPSNTVWNFSAGSLIIDAVEVIDVTGKVVYSNTFNTAEITIDATTLAPGVYFTKVYSGAAVKTIKVVKK